MTLYLKGSKIGGDDGDWSFQISLPRAFVDVTSLKVHPSVLSKFTVSVMPPKMLMRELFTCEWWTALVSAYLPCYIKDQGFSHQTIVDTTFGALWCTCSCSSSSAC